MTNMTNHRRAHLTILGGFTAFAVLFLVPQALKAQEEPSEVPKQFYACYVPSSGVVYRIKEPGLRDACSGKKHVEFSWTDAEGADHGALTGLEEDDHPHYLLADGTRALSGNLTASGIVTASKFVGDGSMLTNLPSGPAGAQTTNSPRSHGGSGRLP